MNAPTELSTLEAVRLENDRLRAEIARLRNEVARALPLVGPTPDFDTPIPDIITGRCQACGSVTYREPLDLCENCDDRQGLPCDSAE